MDAPRVLSGSQLVAKGITNKSDRKLPELGSKEVFPSGSWLEQKQIQSALETRKNLIEVDRIEKSGSISHALWREDLLLAEVTQQTGGYWQYLGHNIGKDLFLLPEEALFLIEVNCLLLKHNGVPVSLQKAYSLCLCEMSVTQYKVYASLSRVGYRVFRHKEPVPDDKSIILKSCEKEQVKPPTAAEYDRNISHTDSYDKEKSNDGIINDINPISDAITDIKEPTNCSTVDKEPKSGSYNEVVIQTSEESQAGESVSNDAPEIKHENNPVLHSDNDSDSLPLLIDADSVKVEIVENQTGSERIENDINNAIEKIMQSSGMDARAEFKGTGDEIPPVYEESQLPRFDEDVDSCSVNENSIITEGDNITEVDQESNMLTFNEDSVIINSVNENIRVLSADDKTAPTTENESTNSSVFSNLSTILNENNRILNVDDNANETVSIATNNNEKFYTETAVVLYYEDLHTDLHMNIPPDIIYSVDDAGIIRITDKKCTRSQPARLVYTDEITDVCGEVGAEEFASATNSTTKHYVKEIKHCDAKIQKLIERKSNAGQRSNLAGFNSIQDFYQERLVRVNVPEEQYLPRNIFLHRTAYVLNVDTVRNQNASNVNVSSYDNDQIESSNRASRGTDPPKFSDLLTFMPSSIFNPQSRYPTYRPHNRPQLWNSRPPLWNSRYNFNFYNYNMFRPAAHSFVPRYRYQPYPIVRQHLLNYNQTTPASTQTDNNRGTAMKLFHFNTLVHIATKLKRIGGQALQIRALHNIIDTYNSRYGEQLELTEDFEIIDRRDVNAREVIVLDDDSEPKRKRQRVNEDSDQINENLERLKALAVKLKDLQMKNLAVSRHRRVFSNAIKTFNKSFNADLYLDSNFEIKDRKLIVLDSSSDSDAAPAKAKHKSVKRKKLRNPYNILKLGLNTVNDGAGTSSEVPVLQRLSLNAINDVASTSQNGTCQYNINTPSPIQENTGEGLLKYFNKAWLPSDEDFGKAELCSREHVRLDALLFEAEYIYNILKESVADFESWLDIKISALKDIQGSLDLQKQQAEALSNDFLMETESQIQPIVAPDCTDLRSALKQLAIISNNKEIPRETSLEIHFDVCNRNVHFKKTDPPMPNFRIICMDESAPFPSSDEIASLEAKYTDAVPIVFAFIGTGSITYLQIKSIDLPVFIPESDPS